MELYTHFHLCLHGLTQTTVTLHGAMFSSNNYIKVKVKFILVQALRLCTGHTAHRGSRGIALPFLNHDTRRGWGVSVTPRPLFTPGKDSVPIVDEAGWAPGPVWTGVEILASTGIRSPDRPACSQALYRLSFASHKWLHNNLKSGRRIWEWCDLTEKFH